MHIKLNYDTHAGLKIECYKKNISIQELFEELSVKFANGHEGLSKIAEKVVRRRTKNKMRALAGIAEKMESPTSEEINTVEALYDMIGEISPLASGKKEELDDSNVIWDDEETL